LNVVAHAKITAVGLARAGGGRGHWSLQTRVIVVFFISL